MFSVASAPSEFAHAVSLAESSASDAGIASQSQRVSVSRPSTIAIPLPSARMIPTRPNAGDKFHSAPDNRFVRTHQHIMLLKLCLPLPSGCFRRFWVKA